MKLLLRWMTSLTVLSVAAPVLASSTNAFWIWGNDVPEEARFSEHLYAYQGVFDIVENRNVYRFEGLAPQPIEGFAGKVILTYRLENLVPLEMVVSRFVAHRQAWTRHGVIVQGLQIDYDSPTAKLPRYANWLTNLNDFHDSTLPISITGLGDWLVSAHPEHLKDISSKISYIAFMMYHGSRPLAKIKQYFARLSRSSQPFKIGLLQAQRNATVIEEVAKSPGYRGEIIFVSSKGFRE